MHNCNGPFRLSDLNEADSQWEEELQSRLTSKISIAHLVARDAVGNVTFNIHLSSNHGRPTSFLRNESRSHRFLCKIQNEQRGPV